VRKKFILGAVVLALAFAFALPSVSAGEIKKTKTPYAGTIAPTGTISFLVLVNHIRTKTGARLTSRAVTKLAFSVPVACDGGTMTVSLNTGRYRNRLYRTFTAGFPVGSEGATVTIHGTRRAGTLQISGNFGSAGNCDSGLLSWTASRR
jgi:hypothetical protein